jgi:cyclic 2,3-diphosphoglycerate synthetase
VLIDGEHYEAVVRDALGALPHDVVAAVFVGGAEKVRGGENYGVPLVATLEEAIDAFRPDLVLDLSDEPVLGPVERMALASRALARGVAYAGADFRFEPPTFAPFHLPSLAVVGTGKRVGKTAVTGHLARLLALDRKVVVVAMGRGGPDEPEVIRVPPTVEALVALSRSGRHAASDHLETAVLAGVETVGCRRAGGGLAGAVCMSNVGEGAIVAAELGAELVVFDGSGAALPPVEVDRRVLVVSALQDPEVATGYLNTYRHLLADLVLVTMADAGPRGEALVERVRATAGARVPVIPVVLRPRPIEPVAGRRVAYFGTAPDGAHSLIAGHLADEYGAEVVYVSGKLGDRRALTAELERIDADAYVVELKAAAVDVVAEAALARGADVVLAALDVVSLEGELDAELRRLAEEAAARGAP